ncbi:hypothetical protein LDENG_00004110 [Lucifuga dentata]|nr:hypothetical protein LDENG_00004110 [Lucifuga dentata]
MLADTLKQERLKKRPANVRLIPSSKFVREGEKPTATKKTKNNLPQTAQSEEMRVDLARRLQFHQVVQITLRPDVVLWSEEAKKILIQLTVL